MRWTLGARRRRTREDNDQGEIGKEGLFKAHTMVVCALRWTLRLTSSRDAA
jgi:hypothetical protein